MREPRAAQGFQLRVSLVAARDNTFKGNPMKTLFRSTLLCTLILSFALAVFPQGYASRIVPQPALPATCQPGNGMIVFLTAGNIGMYQCMAANTWVPIGLITAARLLAAGTIQIDAGGLITWIGRSIIGSSADGYLSFTNNAGASLTRLNFGAAGSVAYASIETLNTVAGQAQGIIIQRADGAPQTQANLGAATNGCIIYCSDCTIASPCAAGGTGAIAKRLNGVWVCN